MIPYGFLSFCNCFSVTNPSWDRLNYFIPYHHMATRMKSLGSLNNTVFHDHWRVTGFVHINDETLWDTLILYIMTTGRLPGLNYDGFK